MASELVYIGVWKDYEEQGIWGWNLTTTSNQATVLTAVLALGISMTGTRSWKIFRYLFHQTRRHDQTRDAMIREQEVFLRNEGSDIGTTVCLVSLLWNWRSFGRLIPGNKLKYSRRSTWLVLVLGLIHWMNYLLLATWLPIILSKGQPNPVVLANSHSCTPGITDALRLESQLRGGMTALFQELLRQ